MVDVVCLDYSPTEIADSSDMTHFSLLLKQLYSIKYKSAQFCLFSVI